MKLAKMLSHFPLSMMQYNKKAVVQDDGITKLVVDYCLYNRVNAADTCGIKKSN